jgi:Na+-driven multidrug efflux pump
MGWGAALSTFVAMNLGAGQKRRAHRAGGLAALYNVVLTAGMAALFLVYSSEIVGFFDKSPGVIMFGRKYMLSVAPSYIVLAGAFVLSQAMTGAGATLTTW